MKTYRELTMPEVLRMLADNQEQVFAVRYGWTVHEVTLLGVDLSSKSELVYDAKGHGWHRKVYEIIEIPDPLIPLKKLEALRELYPEHEWIAMDEDKSAHIYPKPPSQDLDQKCWYFNPGFGAQDERIMPLEGYATDWETSLIHIPTEIERIKKLEDEA